MTAFAAILRRAMFRTLPPPNLPRPWQARIVETCCIACDRPIPDHFDGPMCTGRFLGCRHAEALAQQKA
jgi:hypothetical protein